MIQERCQLYQMKDGEALREYIFQPFAALASKRYFPNETDYNMVYDDLLRPNEDVRAVRERLSTLQRKRGCFRQINTSDVIVLRRETGTICCFVDGDGFVMLDDFFGLPTSGNPLTLETEHYAIPGKKGLWRVVDGITYENVLFFLLEQRNTVVKSPASSSTPRGKWCRTRSLRILMKQPRSRCGCFCTRRCRSRLRNMSDLQRSYGRNSMKTASTFVTPATRSATRKTITTSTG